jgi:PhnB protein
MTSIEPELWVERPREAIAFYEAAFGATVLHRVGDGDGDGDDVVAQLAVGEARFWISNASPSRPSPRANSGATGRLLLVVGDPDGIVARACAAGASELSAVRDEHAWRLGRIEDPAGHEWEIGRPLGTWPPDSDGTPPM